MPVTFYVFSFYVYLNRLPMFFIIQTFLFFHRLIIAIDAYRPLDSYHPTNPTYYNQNNQTFKTYELKSKSKNSNVIIMINDQAYYDKHSEQIVARCLQKKENLIYIIYDIEQTGYKFVCDIKKILDENLKIYGRDRIIFVCEEIGIKLFMIYVCVMLTIVKDGVENKKGTGKGNIKHEEIYSKQNEKKPKKRVFKKHGDGAFFRCKERDVNIFEYILPDSVVIIGHQHHDLDILKLYKDVKSDFKETYTSNDDLNSAEIPNKKQKGLLSKVRCVFDSNKKTSWFRNKASSSNEKINQPNEMLEGAGKNEILKGKNPVCMNPNGIIEAKKVKHPNYRAVQKYNIINKEYDTDPNLPLKVKNNLFEITRKLNTSYLIDHKEKNKKLPNVKPVSSSVDTKYHDDPMIIFCTRNLTQKLQACVEKENENIEFNELGLEIIFSVYQKTPKIFELNHVWSKIEYFFDTGNFSLQANDKKGSEELKHVEASSMKLYEFAIADF